MGCMLGEDHTAAGPSESHAWPHGRIEACMGLMRALILEWRERHKKQLGKF